MDPLELLVFMLMVKGQLNENEVSWIYNARLMSQSQIDLILKDGEDRAQTIMAMRSVGFHEARLQALARWQCGKCETVGQLKNKTINVDEQTIVMNDIYVCGSCKQESSIHTIRKVPKLKSVEGGKS